MKYLAVITLVCLIASISSAPSQITNNNVGDIVTVGVRADVDVSSQVDVTLINIMAKLLSQNLALIVPPRDDQPVEPTTVVQPQPAVVQPQPAEPIPNIPKITPEMIEQFKGLLSNRV